MDIKKRDFLLGGALMGAGVAAGSEAQAQPANLAFPMPEPVFLPINGSSQRFPVRRIYCVGRNYLAHVREMGNDERELPFFFAKHRDMIVQNGKTCAYPALTKDYQHEVELVVAMKSGGMNIPVARALDHVYGYAVGLDMTRRDQQSRMKAKQWPWEIGKSFEDSAPCGAIYPVSAVGHLSKGRIQLAVNGKTRQDSDLAKMIWNVPEIIHHLSTQAELKAGDLIFTGTPEGVGPLKRGDKMTGRIDKLGELAVTVV
jgi:fumarylpyruvate hydrolase